MSHLRKIKDPLYGYVYYSDFEERIISHKLVLRLHHIRQNGCAFLTYPSMRVHRFEHSLGAMHVAGLLFISAALFSDEARVDECLGELLEAVLGQPVEGLMQDLKKASQKQDLSFLSSDSFYKFNHLASIDDPKTFARLLVFQSVRIAALVHDIGHPPFSHTFETVLRQVHRHEYPSHEKVGLELFESIVKDIWESTSQQWYFFAKWVLDLARVIVDRGAPESWRVPALSDIISSDVDADRLDYVRRDTLSAGSTTSAYDLGRLIDAVRFKCVEVWDKGLSLQPVMTTDALSTLEAFFYVRFTLYRWMLWHHNVIRQNLALILAIQTMAELTSDSSEIAKQSSEIFSLAIDKKRRDEYWYFTDPYLLDKLSMMLKSLDGRLAKSTPPDPQYVADGRLRLLHRYLRAFLHREKRHLRPLWKRPDEYVQFGSHVTEQAIPTKGAHALNELLRKAYLSFVESTAKSEGFDSDDEALRRFQSANIDYLSGAFCTKLENHLSNSVTGFETKIRAHYLAKFKPAPEALFLHNRDSDWTKDQGFDIDVLSPSIRALHAAWEGLPHLWLFAEALPEVGVGLPAVPLNVRDLYAPIGKSLKTFLTADSAETRP